MVFIGVQLAEQFLVQHGFVSNERAIFPPFKAKYLLHFIAQHFQLNSSLCAFEGKRGTNCQSAKIAQKHYVKKTYSVASQLSKLNPTCPIAA